MLIPTRAATSATVTGANPRSFHRAMLASRIRSRVGLTLAILGEKGKKVGWKDDLGWIS